MNKLDAHTTLSGMGGALAPDDVIRAKVKAELRKRMRGLRQTSGTHVGATRSAAIVQRLLELPQMQNATHVGLFWPIIERNEVDLRPLAATLLARGVIVALPRVLPPADADAAPNSFPEKRMQFQRFFDEDALVRSAFGVLEPAADAPEVATLSLLVVPALVIDPRGHRIGYGAGYYDSVLAKLPAATITVGVAYDFQLAVEIPNQAWDIAVAHIVTEKRVLAAEV